MEFGVFAFFFFLFAFCALLLLSYLIGIFHIGIFGLTCFFSRSADLGLHASFSKGRMGYVWGMDEGADDGEDLLKERKPGIPSAEEFPGILWLGYMSILGYHNMGIILYIFSQWV